MDNNWTITQTKELFDTVSAANKSGKGLSWAFEKVSHKCGRSCNSVRNYYYSQLKMFQLVPGLAENLGIELVESKREGFELFKKDEVEGLVRTILISKAQGKSVRAVIAELSRGNAKTALRLQNKYRSMLTHHKSAVEKIMADLKAKDIKFFDPYKKRIAEENKSEDNIRKLTEYVSKLDEQEVGSFLQLIQKLL